MNTNRNPELKELLLKLFTKSIDISDQIVAMANDFLFNGKKTPELETLEEIMNTLVSLRNIIVRNKIKHAVDLRSYYAKKHQSFHTLAETIQKTSAEERLALSIREAVTMHIKPVERGHEYKSNVMFYPGGAGLHWAVEFVNISYRDSLQEEIQFLSRIKGNMLIRQQTKSSVSDIRSIKIVNN